MTPRIDRLILRQHHLCHLDLRIPWGMLNENPEIQIDMYPVLPCWKQKVVTECLLSELFTSVSYKGHDFSFDALQSSITAKLPVRLDDIYINQGRPKTVRQAEYVPLLSFHKSPTTFALSCSS
jgi:hypothetical protein